MVKSQAFDFSGLSPGERLKLAQDLWDSVDDAVGTDILPLTNEQRAELDYRLSDLEEAPGDASPWEEAKHEILKLLRKGNRHKPGA